MAGYKRKRIEWLDVAKGMSIILVVFLHSVETFTKTGNGVYNLMEINEFLSAVRMPLFFVATGIVTNFLAQKPRNEYLAKRVFPVLWVLILWFIIQQTAKIYLANYEFEAIKLNANYNIFEERIGVLWFLRAITIYFVICYPLRNLNIYASSLIFLVLSVVSASGIGDDLPLFRTIHYAPYFAIGFFYARWATEVNSRIWILGLAVIPLTGLLVFDYEAERLMSSSVFEFSKDMLGCLFGLSLSFFLAKISIFSKILNLFGRLSLQIYILHLYVLDIILKFIKFEINGIDRYVVIFAMFAVALLAPLLVNFATKKAGMGWLFSPPKFALDRIRFRERKPEAVG